MSDVDIEKVVASGAYAECVLCARTHTRGIPKTHYYVEEEYRAINREGKKGKTDTGVPGVAAEIRKFGAEHFIIGTDFGVYTLPTPVEGMREFIACLLDMGCSEEEIRTVSSTNPGRLLGLND
ncbi:hypothetical protein ES705_29003 [subsurface metagenome]